MTKHFSNSDLTHGTIPTLIFVNYNQSNLDSSQDTESNPVLNHNLTQLHSPQGSGDVDRLCPESSTNSDVFFASKLTTLDETPAGINRSRPNFNDSCDNGCMIPSLHESTHFASTDTVMRDSYSAESPLEVDERSSNVVGLLELSDMADFNSGSQLLPKIEGGVGIKFASDSKFKDHLDTCRSIALLFDTERDQLKVFLGRVIPPQPDKLPAAKLLEHFIDTQGHPPIKQKTHRMSVKVCDKFIKITDQLMDQELVEPCNSEWCNPVVMLRKGDGSYCLCIDFRKVNEISKKHAYPIPFMTEIMDKMSVARYISTIDLNKAYHQIPLGEESKPNTAFIVPGEGLYQYRRMLFGLTEAPGTF